MPTRKWGTEKLVNATMFGNQTWARVTALAGGGYVVVWEDDGLAFSAIRAQVFDTAGNRVGSEIAVIVPPGNQEITPAVTGLAGGGFAVTWTQLVGSSNYILGSVYDAHGTFVRSQPAAFGADQIANGQVTRFGSGTAVVWEEPAGFSEIDFRTFDATGTGSAVQRVNIFQPGDRHDPTIAASPDQSTLAIAWDDQGSIKAALYNAAGTQIAAEFRIDAAAAANVFAPVITWLNNDQYVVSWVQSNAAGAGGNDVKARIFQGGASPAPLTDIFSVNTTTAGNQQAPAITALPNGGFAIAWEDASGIGLDGGPAIRLQAFDAAGGKVGGEIIVNTTTSGIQDEPSLAALPDGRIVVTWRDASATGGDTSGTAIRTQIVDPRDGVITGTPASETLYGNDLTGDEISAGAGNDVLNGLRGDDVLFGGEGNDLLNGGLGADDMYGGTGNDIYVVDNVSDTVTENLNEGTDTVRTTLASYALGANVENLAFIGTGNFTGTGNTLNNVLTGGTGTNTLNGGAGIDVLVAGLHAALTGGTSNDRFDFTTAGTIPAPDTNTIADFVHAADRISFHDAGFNLGVAEGTGTPAVKPLPAALFSPNTDGSFATTGNRFAYDTAGGKLYYDADGSSAAARQLIATLTNHAPVTASDLYFVA
jgi:Ca2+-binding RTX toxin-like protein